MNQPGTYADLVTDECRKAIEGTACVFFSPNEVEKKKDFVDILQALLADLIHKGVERELKRIGQLK